MPIEKIQILMIQNKDIERCYSEDLLGILVFIHYMIEFKTQEIDAIRDTIKLKYGLSTRKVNKYISDLVDLGLLKTN